MAAKAAEMEHIGMAAKKRASRLGRGLSSLMAKPVDVTPPVEDKVEKQTAVQDAKGEAEAVNVRQDQGVKEDAGQGAEQKKNVGADDVSRGARDLAGKEADGHGEEKIVERVAEGATVVEVGVVKMVSADEIIETEGAAENIAAGQGEKVIESVKEEVAQEAAEISVKNGKADNVTEQGGVREGEGDETAQLADHGEDQGGSRAGIQGGEMGLQYLTVSQIVPNRYQPRQEFDERALAALSESIKKDGLMQPIIVRKVERDDLGEGEGGDGGYELVAGERRWRAAQLAELEVMPGFVRELDDEQMAEWALVENLQREDLNPIERAEAFKRLAEVFGLSHSEVAERVGWNGRQLLTTCGY